MGTLIRSAEAAALLEVTPATLYAYVSRGRLTRTTAADGRSSLFDRDEVELLAARSRRSAPGPRPTIDVQITSAVTTMSETTLRFRGRDVVELVRDHHFEDIAELLWSVAPTRTIGGVSWPAAAPADDAACAPIAALSDAPISRLAIAAHVLDASHPGDDPADAARRLLLVAPAVLGSARRGGPYARRLAGAWRARPSTELVAAIDTALGLLADHELATSTLAVRIAASIRPSPYIAYAAGMATLDGALHGSASAEVHAFLVDCAAEDPAPVIERLRRARRRVPGFGHSVYRGVDPRYGPMMDAVRRLDGDGRHVDLVDHVVAEMGRLLPHQPNVDLALGALTWTAGLPMDAPVFAVARIAGWAAHFTEELDERPVRFRGVARPARPVEAEIEAAT